MSDDMSASQAIAAVREEARIVEGHELEAAEDPDFPEFWYIGAIDAKGFPLIGGTIFIVHRTSGTVLEAPGSRPPRVNLEWAREAIAAGGA